MFIRHADGNCTLQKTVNVKSHDVTSACVVVYVDWPAQQALYDPSEVNAAFWANRETRGEEKIKLYFFSSPLVSHFALKKTFEIDLDRSRYDASQI